MEWSHVLLGKLNQTLHNQTNGWITLWKSKKDAALYSLNSSMWKVVMFISL